MGLGPSEAPVPPAELGDDEERGKWLGRTVSFNIQP